MGSLVAEDLAVYLAAIHNELTFQLYEAQDCYKDYINRNRKLHSNFHIGDQVWFLQWNIQTKRLQVGWLIKDWVYSKLLHKSIRLAIILNFHLPCIYTRFSMFLCWNLIKNHKFQTESFHHHLQSKLIMIWNMR